MIAHWRVPIEAMRAQLVHIEAHGSVVTNDVLMTRVCPDQVIRGD